MEEKEVFACSEPAQNGPFSSKVKPSSKPPQYSRFGETIRYLTFDELNRLLDGIEDYRHKLMIRAIFELGCRVGEFVRIQLKHLNFSRNTVFIPAENTKTRQRRTSHLPAGLMNEVKSLLRQEGRMPKRTEAIHSPEEYLFYPFSDAKHRYHENRLRQIFDHYVRKAGLNREYGRDSKGRVLHEITIHSLRHTHCMLYVHHFKLPLPIVQKQVGHKTLKATSVYLRPSDEAVGEAYEEARVRTAPSRPAKGSYTL